MKNLAVVLALALTGLVNAQTPAGITTTATASDRLESPTGEWTRVTDKKVEYGPEGSVAFRFETSECMFDSYKYTDIIDKLETFLTSNGLDIDRPVDEDSTIDVEGDGHYDTTIPSSLFSGHHIYKHWVLETPEGGRRLIILTMNMVDITISISDIG
jgi:hypothetical protein